MSGLIKKLAGETAVYGLSSIIGRLLNYLLVPLYTGVLSVGAYGVSSEFYAYAAFLAIVFTYGMETAFFRFCQKEENTEKVFSTIMISLLVSSLIFGAFLFLLATPLSNFSKNSGRETLFYLLALILMGDALSAIPFAWLRHKTEAKRFAFIRLLNIFVGIVLNLFFYLLCPYLIEKGYPFFKNIYNIENGVMYMFIANAIASWIVFPFFIKELKMIRFGFDKKLWKEMFSYAYPLIFMGVAAMINETASRPLLKYFIANTKEAEEQIGIFSANYKLSILITLFIQAFRFAAEPFFFSRMKDADAKETYAKVMNYFVMVCGFIFLLVLSYLDIFKELFLRNKAYWEGLHVVPILLMANVCLGIYYNLSIWYKLSGKTKIGAAVGIAGAIITLIMNFLLVPKMGYTGAAWATLTCYFSMCVMSYFLGEKYYPVPYDLKKLAFIIFGALFFYAAGDYITSDFSYWTKIGVNNFFLLGYGAFLFLVEKKYATK